MLVVAFHAHDALDRCLRELPDETPVIVVDNSSSPDVQRVASERGADYVDAGSNLGFARGVNLGLRHTEDNADVLLLNPDAAITGDGIDALASLLRAPGNERVAAVAPRIVGVTGIEERVGWPFPSPTRAWFEAVGKQASRSAAEFVIGAVLLLRREALTEVGCFDERFFLYAEETDWQRRAGASGWGSAICDTATAIHVGAASSANERRREVLFHAAQEAYIRKWFGRKGWVSYRVALIVGALARSLFLRRERRMEALRRARLYIRGPARCAAHLEV